jgi:uncharacterized protein (TIGR03084 family)
MQDICDDLTAEHRALDAVVAALEPEVWATATPAAGWSIGDGISHLCFFDQRARWALSPETVETFLADARTLAESRGGPDPSVAFGRAMDAATLLDRWRTEREALLGVARTVDGSARIPWYGPAMAARSFITARLMETWAHGQDIRDALGLAPEVSARLRHVAHIGVRARPFAYATNKRPLPDVEVRVELSAPDATVWAWGSDAAEDIVRGPAVDFCLVVTQRRHVADTSLVVQGSAAKEWMSIAQAFAGPPGPGRTPGQVRPRSR